MEGDVDMAAYQIKEIKQKNNHTFTIKWIDGEVIDYNLSELQKRCPCANCTDEITGEKKIDRGTVDERVKAKRIVSVGRYAIRIEFTSGCSMGIYSYDDLRRRK